MRVGWGNLAGSNVKNIKDGIGRYATIKSYWRENLDFHEINKLSPCYKPNPKLKEKSAISSLSSNIRTFGSTDPEKPWHRVSGAPMNIPNGIEIRIFDHFETVFLISLLKFILLIAANAEIYKSKNFVYENKPWINSLKEIMTFGWRAILDKEYISELEENLDIKINSKSMMAYDILNEVNNALFEKNKSSDLLYMMSEEPNKKMNIPNINRNSWNYAFCLKMANYNKTYERFQKLYNSIPSKCSMKNYSKLFETVFTEKRWKVNELDILYFMESKKMIRIKNSSIIKNSKIGDLIMPFLINEEITNEMIGYYFYNFIKNNNVNKKIKNDYVKYVILSLKEKYSDYIN